MQENNQYGAQNIQILKGLEAVRTRPGMYIGSTGPEGLHHLVYEIVDNSIDEALAGFCTQVDVAIEMGNIIRVEDNGRGIPTDIHPQEGVSALEVVLTKLHAGGKFNKDNYKVSGGLHGVGVSVVNALSTWCEVTVYRANTIFQQKYNRGVPVAPVAQIGQTDKTGTIVRFEPDSLIFKETTTFSFDILSKRLRELAFLNKGIKINIVDERLSTPKSHNFCFEGGVKEFVQDIGSVKSCLISEPIYFEKEKDGVAIECSLTYCDGENENIYTFVNNINTTEGGTHLYGFKSALTRVMNDFLVKTKKNGKASKNAKSATKKPAAEIEKFEGSDTLSGLITVLSVKVPNPQFEGQTKTKLGNSEVKGIVETCCNEALTDYFELNPEVVQIIIDRIKLSAKIREALRKTKEAVRKSAASAMSLPGKLADCRDKNPANTEVFIVEGDSAGGSAKQGRNSEFQAILALWGKMLNVEKSRYDKVITNDKLAPVIATLGTGIGKDFDISKIRYHKVIIMADADVDGSHIRTLLLTFFFRYFPSLIEKGHIYIAMPPLYKIEKGKIKHYAYDDEEKAKILKEMGVDENNVKVQRYKGLGEMNPDQLWETTMNPETRKMIQVKLEDAVEADMIMSTLMGDEVPPRRKFIEDNALAVMNLDV